MIVRLAPLTVAAAFGMAAPLLAGCSGAGPSVTGNVGSLSRAATVPNEPLGTSAIEHVVIIVQENRSFDNMFHGFPGADTAQSGTEHDGTQVTLQPVKLSEQYDIDHGYGAFRAAYDGGRSDGFDRETVYGYLNGKYQALQGMGNFPYSYLLRSDIQEYWELAGTYALADRMFQSNGGPSFPAHQYLIAGQADNAITSPAGAPWGCDSAPTSTVVVLSSTGAELQGPFPCFTYQTLADELDRRGVTWRYYAPSIAGASGIYSAYDAIRQIRYGPDWPANVLSPETRVLADVSAGTLAGVTWVVPTWQNSDHPGVVPDDGPAWVASIVNAIGHSKFWPNTAIFIVWDDWGGWYDHVTPAQYDVMGLGFRVPLIVVSPYARRGYVSHVQHEFGSILKFVEDDFDLPSLNEVDARSDNLSDCFDFTGAPRAYQTIATGRAPSYFLRARQSMPPDDDL